MTTEEVAIVGLVVTTVVYGFILLGLTVTILSCRSYPSCPLLQETPVEEIIKLLLRLGWSREEIEFPDGGRRTVMVKDDRRAIVGENWVTMYSTPHKAEIRWMKSYRTGDRENIERLAKTEDRSTNKV